MPASGNAKIRRSSTDSRVIGAPAHAALLTATTRMAVAASTNRLDRVFTTGHSSGVGLHGVDRDVERAAGAVELALLGRVDLHELPALDLHADQALAADLTADVGRRDEAVVVEVRDAVDRVEHRAAGDPVGTALGDDAVHRGGEDLSRDPRLGAEGVGLGVVLQEVVELRVAALVLEGEEREPHVVVLDRRATRREEAGVVALQRAVPDLHRADTLHLRFLAEEHVA